MERHHHHIDRDILTASVRVLFVKAKLSRVIDDFKLGEENRNNLWHLSPMISNDKEQDLVSARPTGEEQSSARAIRQVEGFIFQ